MILLNIKTENNYYLYDTNRKMIYGSNINTYLVYQYFIDTYKIFKPVTDKEIIYISKYLAIEIQEVKKSINRLHYLFELINIDIQFTKVITPKISENEILDSISNINQILIEVTEACNFECNYCCYGELYYNSSERNKYIKIDQCISFIDNILNLKLNKRNRSIDKHIVISFYGGEPLLNFNAIQTIVEHVNLLYSKDISFSFSMTTNGYLLDKYIDYLEFNNFAISISLDGNYYQNKYRRHKNQSLSYDKVYDNISIIRTKYPEYYKNKIGFISVLHNLNSRTSLLKYFSSINKSPLITQLTKDGVRSDKMEIFKQMYNKDETTNSEIDSLQKNDPQIYKLITDRLYDIDSIVFNYNSKSDIYSNKITIQNIKSGSCYLFQSRIFYTTEGILYPCEKVNRKFSFGQYKANRFYFNIDAINKYYSHINNTQSIQCKECAIKKDCEKCYFNDPNIFNKCNSYMSYELLTSIVTDIIEFHESKYTH